MADTIPRETVRDTLTSPASISLAGWAATLLPASVLVVVQEAFTPFPSFAFVLLSALAQHAADGVLAAIALTVQRLAPRADRLLIRLVLWTAIGLSRGIVGGTLAATFAGVDADYGYRVAFWLVVTWTWMPTISFTLAQLETRRRLLGMRDAARVELDEQHARAARLHESLRETLLTAVQAGIGPAVDEIRARLVRMGSSIDAASSTQIGDRIAAIADETAVIVGRRPIDERTEIHPAAPRASLWAAIEFDQRRPLWGAAVMAIGMTTLLLPDTLRVAGPGGALTVGLGILASTAVVLLSALLEKRVRLRARAAQVGALVLRVLAAAVAGSATILLFRDGESPELLLDAALLPIVAGLAASIVPTIVGTRRANLAVADEIEGLRDASFRAEQDSLLEEERVRTQVSELLHGPILGRLSACAMALGFHASADPPPDPERTSFITTAVLTHLAAVARDLETLSARPGRAPGTEDGIPLGGDRRRKASN